MYSKKQITRNHILSITIGIVYLWFGGLKFFADLSPAEMLAKNTISFLTFEAVPPNISIIILALSETIIGILLIFNIYPKHIITIAIIHMAFTFTPLFIFPDQTFGDSIFKFTLLGQYIFKNVIIIGALITLYNFNKAESLIDQKHYN